jgi:hypothetical protein
VYAGREIAAGGKPMVAPFLISQEGMGYKGFWDSETGEQYCGFSQCVPWQPGYKVFGDFANTSGNPRPNMSMTFAANPDCPWALASPTGFTWILDDAGSGNPNDVSYWWPTAPADYVALGLCFSSGDQPDPATYWCIHKSFVVETTSSLFWSDAGQGWSHHDGNLVIPDMPAAPPPNALIPCITLSTEAMRNGMGAPYVLSWS